MKTVCKICNQPHGRNSEVCSKKCRQYLWRIRNRTKFLATRKQYRLKSNSVSKRLLASARTKVFKALTGRVSKTIRTEQLIGCTVEELKLHLQRQFKPGMAWNNYGLWHVDHRIPCSAFDLTDEGQQRECFHFTNLQPLWAADNIKKSNKVSSEILV